jgi:hypothetical protein
MHWLEDKQSATALLARRMVELECLACQLEREFHYTAAECVWFERDEIRHQRSLLLRQLWRLAAVG